MSIYSIRRQFLNRIESGMGSPTLNTATESVDTIGWLFIWIVDRYLVEMTCTLNRDVAEILPRY
ncbi:MAG: hypothetical protein ACFB0D_02675 [Phormidesmis sp.]